MTEFVGAVGTAQHGRPLCLPYCLVGGIGPTDVAGTSSPSSAAWPINCEVGCLKSMGACASTDVLFRWAASGALPLLVSHLACCARIARLGQGALCSRTGALPTFVAFVQANRAWRNFVGIEQQDSSGARQPAVSSGMPPLGCRGSLVKRKRDLMLSLKLVTINIRTLFDSGKMKFVVNRLHSMKADVVFVQETRLPEHADLEQLDGFQLYQSFGARAMAVHMFVDS
eukprot:536332-Amphidinium_carterae.1